MNKQKLPTFTIVIETANLEVAGLDHLKESMDTLERQTLHPSNATEVLLIDSGVAGEDLIREINQLYPWARVVKASGDYYTSKMVGFAESTGELIVFTDSDCRNQPEWLESLITPFIDNPDLKILSGQTSIPVRTPYSLAAILSWSFPPFLHRKELWKDGNYLANNYVMRREVLEDCPIPENLPVYRGNCAIHCMLLRHKGYRILRQPRARSFHPLPARSISAFFWRWLVHGRDQLMWFRIADQLGLPPQSRLPLPRDVVTFLRIVSVGTLKPLRRTPLALRQNPLYVFFLPFSYGLISISTSIALMGYFAGLVNHQRVLKTVLAKLADHGH